MACLKLISVEEVWESCQAALSGRNDLHFRLPRLENYESRVKQT